MLRIYIETSVLNFLFVEDAPEMRASTERFFKEISLKNKCFVSTIVIDEISASREPRHSQLVDALLKWKLEVLPFPPRAEKLAQEYVHAGLIPARYLNDARHIAAATIHKADIIVTWNMEHLDRPKTKVGVNKINSKQGYIPISIEGPDKFF
jgi:predicted nucleic acid-binding protein